MQKFSTMMRYRGEKNPVAFLVFEHYNGLNIEAIYFLVDLHFLIGFFSSCVYFVSILIEIYYLFLEKA